MPDFINQIYSPVAMTLLFVIPAFVIFGLVFDLVIMHMILKPTVNLFRRIQHKPKI